MLDRRDLRLRKSAASQPTVKDLVDQRSYYTTVMPVADHWYSSSANLISITGSTVAFLAVLIGAWLTYWLTVPRCRLTYALVYALPINREKPQDSTFEEASEKAHSTTQSNLYRLRVELRAHGSRDISSSAFDRETPLILDCGLPLIGESIKVHNTPQSVPAPKTIVNGTSLEVGPGLINRRHVLTYDILAEGAQERIRLACRSSLTDVAVRRDRKDQQLGLAGSPSVQSNLAEITDWLTKLLIGAALVYLPSLLHYLSVINNPVALVVTGLIIVAVTMSTVIYVRRQGFSD